MLIPDRYQIKADHGKFSSANWIYHDFQRQTPLRKSIYMETAAASPSLTTEMEFNKGHPNASWNIIKLCYETSIKLFSKKHLHQDN
jgi:hypothetical protein